MLLSDAAGEVLCLPLSYFGTPCLGHVASWCAARVGSPKSSAVQGLETNIVRHLDWKSLEGMCLLGQWNGGKLRARGLSWEMSNPRKNVVRMPLARW
ncbi:hypothetical protein COP1_035452 [Malus domestica]